MPRPVLDSIPELFASLGRDPEELIGQPETSWLDFKEQSYRLDKTNPDRDRACFELAKDASALANARGGVIVVGVETRVEPTLREEVATRLRPVPEGAVNPKQIQDVLWEWIHPKLNVQTQAHQIGNKGEIWSIFIEHQQERDFPFIVGKEFVVEGKGATRNLFGIYTRVGSQNSPYPPA